MANLEFQNRRHAEEERNLRHQLDGAEEMATQLSQQNENLENELKRYVPSLDRVADISN